MSEGREKGQATIDPPAYARERRAQRRAEGKCIECGEPAPDASRCEPCAEKRRKPTEASESHAMQEIYDRLCAEVKDPAVLRLGTRCVIGRWEPIGEKTPDGYILRTKRQAICVLGEAETWEEAEGKARDRLKAEKVLSPLHETAGASLAAVVTTNLPPGKPRA